MKRNKWLETKERLSKCEKGDKILVRIPSGRSKCAGFPQCLSFRLCNLGPEWFTKCHLCSLPHSGFCWAFKAISTNIYTPLYNLQSIFRGIMSFSRWGKWLRKRIRLHQDSTPKNWNQDWDLNPILWSSSMHHCFCLQGIDIIGEISATQPTRDTFPGKYFFNFIMKVNKKIGILATMRQQK